LFYALAITNLTREDIDSKRMERLESIGLVDDLSTGYEQRCTNSSWDDMFSQLLEFKQKHGHLKVSHQCNKNKKLRVWVSNRRRDYKEYKRTNGQKGDPERMKCLESIGLVDDITTKVAKGSAKEHWYGMYDQLLEFKQKHGHVKVPQRDSENKKLGMWVKYWRRNYREYKRTNGQKGDPVLMEHLESIGLVDDITTTVSKEVAKEYWYGMYNQLLEFKQKHGHVKVPQQCDENKKLAIWVNNWRRAYRKYKRTDGKKGDPERMKCLESIGLVDDITTGYAKDDVKEHWYGMYNQLLEFKQKHGHVKVPQQYNENKKLGAWVNNWRGNYREYKRSNGQKGDPERMKHLESIGLVDDIIRKHEDKMKDCADNKVFAPIIVSSMSPILSSNTQNITEEMPLSTVVKGGNNDESGDDNSQADLDFLGSELRGGFWV
jgi:glycerol-3-phosphate cytidylyltransferase-like family protein